MKRQRKWFMVLMVLMAVIATAVGCVTPQPCATPIAPDATAKLTSEDATDMTLAVETTPDVTKLISYNEADIARAKAVAEAYYRDNTNVAIESIEYDTTYNEVNEVRFVVTIKGSENPSRSITIVRVDKDSAWEVKEGSEGY